MLVKVSLLGIRNRHSGLPGKVLEANGASEASNPKKHAEFC